MKTKTSFLNGTVLKKDITRYAPIWAAYTIFLLLVLFGLTNNEKPYFASEVLDSLMPMAWLNLLYGGVCAAFLFMDLFNGRLCNALHAFPFRRESWLATHLLSGLLFSLVPNLLASAVASLILWDYAYVVPIWLAVSTLQYLFFFGSAVLCAVCAGNLIGTAAIYGIFHFITLLVHAVLELLYLPLLYGVQLNTKPFYRFFPLNQFSSFEYAKFTLNYATVQTHGEYGGLIKESWLYLGLCALAGIVSIVLAWRVYRKRQLESAGDLISLKALSPLFLIICAIGAGAFLYLLFNVLGSGSYVLLVIGLIIGFFAAKMLLNRSVKVFTKKSFLGLGLLVLILGGSMLVTRLDPLGVTRYVPELDDIQSATVLSGSRYSYFPLIETYSWIGEENRHFQFTEEKEITSIQDFHRQLLQHQPDDESGGLCHIRVFYTLKNGRTVTRYYQVDPESSLGHRAREFFSDIRYVFEVTDPEILYEVFESVTLETYTEDKLLSAKLVDPEEIAGLIDAIKKDCEAGTMSQHWAFHDSKEDGCYVEFYAKDAIFDLTDWNTSRHYIQVWSNCTNTRAYIQSMLAAHADATK